MGETTLTGQEMHGRQESLLAGARVVAIQSPQYCQSEVLFFGGGVGSGTEVFDVARPSSR